ncbi:hypothetical protein [Arthrobacter sp. UYCu712]|uniref:hypothetical protein n=1 Tax=Arthrobacter sp. UYCu712 TaxID=3156340 RepID=UPI00339133F4
MSAPATAVDAERENKAAAPTACRTVTRSIGASLRTAPETERHQRYRDDLDRRAARMSGPSSPCSAALPGHRFG